jgi:hypothetical protein
MVIDFFTRSPRLRTFPYRPLPAAAPRAKAVRKAGHPRLILVWRRDADGRISAAWSLAPEAGREAPAPRPRAAYAA